METRKELTVREIIHFYIGKEKNQPLTDWIMNNGYGQVGGDYIGVANVLGTDDKQVIQILLEKKKELLGTEELSWLEVLYDRQEVILSEEEQSKPNQKWHLLISYYAYKLIVQRYGVESKVVGLKGIEEKTSTVFGKLKCPELCLWMVEAAVDGEILTVDEMEELFHQVVEAKRQGCKWNSYLWWNENKEKYDTKLAEIILKEKERGEKIYETQITHE